MGEVREYKLVSDKLYDAVYGSPQDTPVYRQWLTYMGSLETQIPACWDEEAVVTHVRKMLDAAGRLFLTLPDPVRELKNAHEAAESGGVEYIRYALSVKLKEVMGILANAKPRAQYEKSLRTIQRGLVKRSRRIESFDILDIITRIGGVLEEMEDLSFQEERLIAALELLNILEGLKERLSQRLAEIGGLMKMDKSSASASGALNFGAADFAFDGRSGDPGDAERKRKRDTLQLSKASDVPRDKDEAASAEEQFDPVKISLAKLRRAIELAGDRGKLRVIVPHRDVVRQRSEQKWRALFEQLGYGGEVEFLTFEELSRSRNGTEIPIVMLRSLNTHANLWRRGKYNNVFVLDVTTQNAISDYLGKSQTNGLS